MYFLFQIIRENTMLQNSIHTPIYVENVNTILLQSKQLQFGSCKNFFCLFYAPCKGQQISKYETENIGNINSSQNTKARRYPEQLYRLGMFMFWQIAVARPLINASLIYLVSNYFTG